MTKTDQIAQLQQQIEALKQQLIQAQKMTALGELVGTTTHEFNNILMTIINYAKLGMAHDDKPTRDKALEKIFTAAQRASKITNSVLGMARNRKAGREPVDPAALFEECLLLLEREMNKYRISVEKVFAPTPEAYVHANQIQQVLLNLLINARQAMSNGGRLILKLYYDDAKDMVCLVVRDFGAGIPADRLPSIFNAFYTTKEGPDDSGKGGTGLGLAMCREIIESHGGRIRVESAVGKGTAFTLLLPTVKKAKPTTDAAPAVVGMTMNPPFVPGAAPR